MNSNSSICKASPTTFLIVVLAPLLFFSEQQPEGNQLHLRYTAALQHKTILGPSKSAQHKAVLKTAPRRPQQEPCWKEAGISPEAIARQKTIVQETQARVREICASSAPDEEKRQQIRDVRRAANQEIQGLTTPERRAALKQCNQQRAEQRGHSVARLPRPAMPNARPQATGPCGEMR
jgi:hypothetical protein